MFTSSPRRNFIKKATLAGLGIALTDSLLPFSAKANFKFEGKKRIGIIGLDTSHCVAFAKALNASDAGPEYGGFKIVAAYPKGSLDIQSSVERVPGYTADVVKLGVEIVDSIAALLEKVDFVLLETECSLHKLLVFRTCAFGEQHESKKKIFEPMFLIDLLTTIVSINFILRSPSSWGFICSQF